MFTGIIETTGRVTGAAAQPTGRRLSVDVGDWRGRSGSLAVGDSVAVDGVCLTVAEAAGSAVHFDVIGETLSKSTLGERMAGDAVNLESSLTASTPMGGHVVQGHVDGVGRVVEVRRGEGEWVVAIQPPAELLDYLGPKGSVAVNGVSLTLAALHEDAFEVALIPTTLEATTLGALRADDRVNLEADTIAKTVVHWLRRQGGEQRRGVTWERLRAAGFE